MCRRNWCRVPTRNPHSLCLILLAAVGCVRVDLSAAGAPGMTPERYRELREVASQCIKRGSRSIECLIDQPVRRNRVRFLAGVRSADDVKVLRSGRICGTLSRGGVKCLGRDMIRAIEALNSSEHGAFIWDDGYCVQERDQEHVRCEWFSPDSEWDRRVLFLKLRGGVSYQAAPGGMCVCSAPRTPSRRQGASAPVTAACLMTKVSGAQTQESPAGTRYVRRDALEVVQFAAGDYGSSTGVCEALRADPSSLDRIISGANNASPTGSSAHL